MKRPAPRASTTVASLLCRLANRSALLRTALSSFQTVKWRWRNAGLPVSSGRPSAFHLAMPPSNIATSCAPNKVSIHHARVDDLNGLSSYTTIRLPSPRPSDCIRLANFSGGGKVLGRLLFASANSSRSMNTADGIWPPSYSACALRPASGMKYVASTTRKSDAPISLANHSVLTNNSMFFVLARFCDSCAAQDKQLFETIQVFRGIALLVTLEQFYRGRSSVPNFYMAWPYAGFCAAYRRCAQ